MEAVKKLPMISFELKNSPEASSFRSLKQYIAECYHEDPESYTKEFSQLEQLRGIAVRPRIDFECCATLKRYYAQLHSLQNRFPSTSDDELLKFVWKDIYTGNQSPLTNFKYEMASILYNIAALHSQLGIEESRADPESMKIACSHFQCAAWALGELKTQYAAVMKGDLSTEVIVFMQHVCFAQAQECILEKSIADNRKAAIIAKVTAQVVSFYNTAASSLFCQSEDGSLQDLVGSKIYKEWQKYIKFKTSYLSSILFLYQGQHSEEQQKMGERVTLYNAACEKLEEAKKESKGLNKIEIINEALVFTTDVVEGKRKNAKNENDFIYHEEIPDISSISAVQGANLVTGIGFDVTDAEIIGDDIFKRLVPMETHENLSRYSEEKAKILRNLKSIIDERDIELKSFMGSLSMDALNSINKSQQERLPQGLVDRCAELSAKPNAIPDLVASMSNLADICSDVEITLKDIKQILDEENRSEQNYQKQMGKRPTVHIMELNREFTKYFDAHNKAGESNDTLRKAMELHVSNLKILSQPLSALQSQVPQTQDVVDENSLKDLINLRNKVNEMQEQRDKLYFDLRETILNNDDITKQLVANGEKNVDELFKKELNKYTHTVNIIEQNLVAQGNILKALTDTYAKYAPILKNINDTKTKRDQFYSSLVASFDVYEDLLSKSSKGLDFYKKLHGNVQKLISRVKAARDVQSEDRQQMLKTSAMNVPANQAKRQEEMKSTVNQSGSGRKLKDYMKSGVGISGSITSYRDDMNKLPGVRPSPVGQENVPAALPSACQPAMYGSNNKGRNQSAYQQPQGHQELPAVYGNTYYNPTSNDQRGLHSGNSSMSGSSTSLNSDYYNQTPKYAMVAGNNSGATGYVNPIYQTPNYQAADSNAFQQYPQANYSVANNQNYSNYQGTGSAAGGGIQTYANSYQNYQSPTTQQQQPQYHPAAVSTPPQQQSQQQQQPKQQVPAAMTQYGYQNNYTAAAAQQPSMASVNSTSYSDGYNIYVQPSPAKDQIPQQNNNYSQYGNNTQQYQMPAATSQVASSDAGTYANQSHVQPTSTSVQYTQSYTQYSTPQQQQQQQQPQSPAVSQVLTNQQQYTQYPATDQYNNYYTNYQTPQQPASPYNQQNYSCYTPTQNATNSYSYANSESTSVTNSATYDTVNQSGGQMNNAQHQQPTHQDSPQHHASAIPTYTNSLTTATHNSGTTNLTQSQQQISSSTEQNMQQVVPTVMEVKPAPVPVVFKSTNIDLLSCIDFSIENSPMSSIPTLTPMSMTIMKPTIDEKIHELTVVEQAKQTPIVEPPMNPDLANLDILSGIENISLSERKKSEPDMMTKSLTEDVFDDTNLLKVFHKEVETLEKFYDTLTVKTLNGVTPLANKWKELQDLLVRDEAKRSVSVAKLFPDKNRLTDDCLPYDHARVLLMKAADNYINAVFVKDCGHISFILTQTPMKNTVNDYWEMVWSQKSNTLVCLHTAAEILDPFWPTIVDEEKNYGDVSVQMLKQFEHSQSLERTLKVTRHGSDVVMNVSLLQIKTWKKNSAANILDIAGNIITSYKQQNPDDNQQCSPVVINCLTGGSERSGLVTVGISTILAMQMRKPTLLNVVDHWFRICSQRKGALTDDSYMQLSLQIVLNNAHKILNKRGIMTSYQMKNSEKLTTEVEPEIKDSLQELDPFWKFK